LLAQVDASVGGKTGINFSGVKNLLGSITQPAAVVIDIDTVATLPAREKLSGFAEMIKHGAIADKGYFLWQMGY
jgi:3-dehydroquinate synthase